MRHGRLVGKFYIWECYLCVFFLGVGQVLGSTDLCISVFLFGFSIYSFLKEIQYI